MNVRKGESHRLDVFEDLPTHGHINLPHQLRDPMRDVRDDVSIVGTRARAAQLTLRQIEPYVRTGPGTQVVGHAWAASRADVHYHRVIPDVGTDGLVVWRTPVVAVPPMTIKCGHCVGDSACRVDRRA